MSSALLDMNVKEEPAYKYQDIFGKMPFKDTFSSNLELYCLEGYSGILKFL